MRPSYPGVGRLVVFQAGIEGLRSVCLLRRDSVLTVSVTVPAAAAATTLPGLARRACPDTKT